MTWIAVGIGAAVGVAGGAIYGSQKGGDAVWKDALMGGAVGSLGGAGAEAFGGAGTAIGSAFGSAAPEATEAATGSGILSSGQLLGGAAGSSVFGAGAPAVGATGVTGADIGAGSFGSSIIPSAATGATSAAGTTADTTAAGVMNGSLDSGSATVGNVGGFAPTAGSETPAGTAANVADKAAQNPSWWASLTPTQKMLAVGAGTAGLGALIAQNNKQYGTPGTQPYTGALSSFHYNPSTFTPNTVTPNVYQAQYADGGITQLSPDQSMMASGSGNVDFMSPSAYPMSQQERTYFNSPNQMPTSAQQAMASYEPATNPLTGEPTANMARGGIAALATGGQATYDPYSELQEEEMYSRMSDMPQDMVPTASAKGGIQQISRYNLGGYSDGGRLLRGPGDGVSDSIPAQIGEKQPARLADGEFVVPARIVSELGNGSTEAGARQLYQMMDRIQSGRKKSIGKGKVAVDSKARKNLPA